MEKTIHDVMVLEHEKIGQCLKEFYEKKDGSIKESAKAFEDFKWNLEKHMFLEEKAIFDIDECVEGNAVNAVFRLMEEHGRLFQMVVEIEKKPSLENFKKLKNALITHRDLEEKEFYPKLEECLDENRKKEIKDKIKEIIDF